MGSIKLIIILNIIKYTYISYFIRFKMKKIKESIKILEFNMLMNFVRHNEKMRENTKTNYFKFL